MNGAAKIELQKCRRRMGKETECRRPMGNAAQNSHQRGSEDSDQNSAIDLARHEHDRQGEAEACGLHFLVRETSEANESSGVRDHQLGIAQADEGDEHSDAEAVECLRQSGMPLTICSRTRVTVSSKNSTPEKKNHRQRRLPRNMHVEADGISEVRVQRHPRRKRDGVVGVKAHHQRGRRRRDTRGKHHALGRAFPPAPESADSPR